ncbi:MAG: hypothetical protein QOH13_1434 [Thermoleophilaceae bacterium]|nr:hypothetical protein [Thermoleophilaceae bacterium]
MLAPPPVEFACALCHEPLVASEDELELTCHACGARYPVAGGIPILSALAENGPADEYKRRQIEFFDGEAAEFEITRPVGQPRLYGWLLTEKFRRSIRGIETHLAGASVLTVCGGSGMDAEFLARRGARVIASDLSLGAAERARERARRRGLSIVPIVADVEHLPFLDRSVDIVYVHDGLHHLNDPIVGLSEMCRVARHAVAVTEPARAAVTALAVRLGLALREEDAGNRVERVSAEQITACLAEHGLHVVGVDRYAMYYQHEPGPWMRFFSRRRASAAARLGLAAGNRLIGAIGNKVSVRATRDRSSAT